MCCNHSKIWIMWLYHRVMSPNDADGMANSVDLDQTASLGAVWSGSSLFAQTYLSENLGSLRSIKTVKMSVVCSLSSEPLHGFWPNLHRNTIMTRERNGSILVTLASFSRSDQHWMRSHQHSECQILTKKSLSAPCLLNQMMDLDQTSCIVSLG